MVELFIFVCGNVNAMEINVISVHKGVASSSNTINGCNANINIHPMFIKNVLIVYCRWVGVVQELHAVCACVYSSFGHI